MEAPYAMCVATVSTDGGPLKGAMRMIKGFRMDLHSSRLLQSEGSDTYKCDGVDFISHISKLNGEQG